MFAKSSAVPIDTKPAVSFKKKAAYISPFVRVQDFGLFSAGWNVGKHTVRLIPNTNPDSPRSLLVTVVPVNMKDKITGEVTKGKILSGDWFKKVVEPYILNTHKNRIQTKANPSGDVVLRTKNRVIFLAGREITSTDPKAQTRVIGFVDLPATGYKTAKAGIGDEFLAHHPFSETPGAFYEDFDAESGRNINFTVSGEGLEKTIVILPDRKASPIDEANPYASVITALVERGAGQLPDLRTLLRPSKSEEIIECLTHTLPFDIVAAFLADGGENKLKSVIL